MELKRGKVYASRWQVDPKAGRPLSETTYRVYQGLEVADEDSPLAGRPALMKVSRYSDDPDLNEVRLRREALEWQRDILALEHFMLPEPLDFCCISNVHTPAISGTDLQDTEPLLVYAFSPGETLRETLTARSKRKSQPRPIQTFAPLDALEVVEKVTNCMSYLHEQGYGHAALNPNHFVYHKGSLRVLGLSKIGSIDPETGYLHLFESPYLHPWEQAFLPREALALRQFGLGTEYYTLALLFLYLVTGIAPSQAHVSSERRLAELPLCQSLQDLLNGWLADWQRPYGGNTEQGYLEQIIVVRRAQRRYEYDQHLAAAKVGIFVDYENTYRSLALGYQPDRRLLPDFEALAAAYQETGPVYRFIVVPEYRLRGAIRNAFDDLERAGWDVHVVSPPDGEPDASLDETDDAVLVQAATRHLELAEPQHLVIVANDRDYFSLIKAARFRGTPVTVVLSRSSLMGHRAVSPEYRRRLDEKQVEIRLLSSYPYVFAGETQGAFGRLGWRRRLPTAYGSQYKSWTTYYEG